MTFSPLDSALFGQLFCSPTVGRFFTDERQIAALVEVEAALARAQGRLGVVPTTAAEQISTACASFKPDHEALREGMLRDGFPIIALVQQLQAHVGNDAASYVHWGATTQDVMDTSLVLRLRGALGVMEATLALVIELLAQHADTHRDTLMVGRTHSQHALPITFGLKVTAWLAPLLRHRERLQELKARLLVVQFGGAVGTLASLGKAGLAVQHELAKELKLDVPLTPWHTQRDSLVEFASWLSLLSGSLAKMAQDVILLTQSEIAEVRESDDPSRGGSSTMPQKSNPVVSELIVAAARANASLLSGVHQAGIQEHERATSGWQLEWLTLSQMVGLTAGALENAVTLVQHLVVDTQRMKDNVAASGGLMLAEMLTFALSEHMDRTQAKSLIGAAARTAAGEGLHLVQVVRERTDTTVDWSSIDEQHYVGASGELIDRVLRYASKELIRETSSKRC